MVFIGGAVLADVMKDKKEFWLTKQQYDEMGLDKLLQLKYGAGSNKYYDNSYE